MYKTALHSSHSPLQQLLSHTEQNNALNNATYTQINRKHKLKFKKYNKTGLCIGQTGWNSGHEKGQVFCAINLKQELRIVTHTSLLRHRKYTDMLITAFKYLQ